MCVFCFSISNFHIISRNILQQADIFLPLYKQTPKILQLCFGGILVVSKKCPKYQALLFGPKSVSSWQGPYLETQLKTKHTHHKTLNVFIVNQAPLEIPPLIHQLSEATALIDSRGAKRSTSLNINISCTHAVRLLLEVLVRVSSSTPAVQVTESEWLPQSCQNPLWHLSQACQELFSQIHSRCFIETPLQHFQPH